jgi:hypothetical protein
MGSSIAWQAQILIVAGVLGGGYLAFVNKFPPFDKGGIFDQLMKLFPKKKKHHISSEDDDSGDSGGSPMPLDIQGTPIAPQYMNQLNPPRDQRLFPPVPQAGQIYSGPQGSSLPGGGKLPPNGMIQQGIMSTSRAGDPTSGEMNVYDNYIKALQYQYGPGNQANLGPVSSTPAVAGDPNLGTTPTPASFFQAPQIPGMPPGMGPMGPMGPGGMTSAQMGGMTSPFGNPAMPPGAPFLPNPMQYPGPVQSGPYPSTPYGMPPGGFMMFPPPPGIIIDDDDYWRRHGRWHRRNTPWFHTDNDLFGIDLGDIIGDSMRGLHLNDLLGRVGGDWHSIFPAGIDRYDPDRFKNDIHNFVMQQQGNNLGSGILGAMENQGFNGFTNYNNLGTTGASLGSLDSMMGVGGGVNNSLLGGNGMLGGMMDGIGSMMSSMTNIGNMSNMMNGSSFTPDMSNFQNTMSNLPSMQQTNIPGISGQAFQSNAGFVLPSSPAYKQFKGSNSMPPFIKRTKKYTPYAGSSDRRLSRLGN